MDARDEGNAGGGEVGHQEDSKKLNHERDDMSVNESLGNTTQAPSGTPEGVSKLSGSLACGREKYWDECDLAEKVERLREALVSLNDDQLSLGGQYAELVHHQHAADGKLLAPVGHARAARESMGDYVRDRSWRLKTQRERERGR